MLPTEYDNEHSRRAVNFFERTLCHTKGQWAGRPFELAPWQRNEIIMPLFGNVDDTGRRNYRTAFLSVGRKNGKSEIAAGVALYLLLADGEEGAEVYGAACDREQASIVFNVAAEMVRRSPVLAKMCKIVDSRKTITVPSTGSFYRAIPADSAGAHGYNAHGIIFDELHNQPNRDLWDVLTTSTGARHQPLVFSITTAGFDRQSICWEQHEYANKVLSGVIEDPRYFAWIRSVPEEADWQDESNWYLANPALGDFRDIDEMRTFARRAKETPALENTFRQLYLSQWTQSESRFIPLHKWDATAGAVDAEALRGRECYAGLDLASTTDIAAMVLVFPPRGESDIFQTLPYFWIPEESMVERERKDRVPYSAWIRKGLVYATPGNVIDHAFIRKTLNDLSDKYYIKEVAFDRWGAVQVVTQLMDDGFNMVQFGQGFASMSAPTKELLGLVLQGRLHHGGNPVLRWMCDNLVVRRDPAGNLKPDKEKSSEKIDGMVALVMALDRAIKQPASGPLGVYTF